MLGDAAQVGTVSLAHPVRCALCGGAPPFQVVPRVAHHAVQPAGVRMLRACDSVRAAVIELRGTTEYIGVGPAVDGCTAAPGKRPVLRRRPHHRPTRPYRLPLR